MEKENWFVLTEETVREKAVSYVPMRKKEAFVETAVSGCFSKIELMTDGGDVVPPVFMENVAAKNRFMAAALLRLYLRLADEAGAEATAEEWLLPEEEYDAFSASFPLNQLERMKKASKDRSLQDKIYDMTADYRLLEKMLNAECYGRLNAMNDVLSRFRDLTSAQLSPELLQALLADVEESRESLEKLMAERREALKG